MGRTNPLVIGLCVCALWA